MIPVINSSSKKVLEAIIDKLPQSLLLTGEAGAGLTTIAKYIAEKSDVRPMVILPEKDEKIDFINGIISVDIMRRLYEETSTKTASKRIIIIDFAERMTVQAQNAFLKLLEEPGNDIHFILVSSNVSRLLPTILSRTEKLDIKPISNVQSLKLLDLLNVKDETKRSQLIFMASGLPAELTRLATDERYFECRATIVRDAREILRGSLYQKLLIAQKYKDDRFGALMMLNDASKIVKKSLSDKPSKETVSYIGRILTTISKIEANGNIRLAVAQMVV